MGGSTWARTETGLTQAATEPSGPPPLALPDPKLRKGGYHPALTLASGAVQCTEHTTRKTCDIELREAQEGTTLELVTNQAKSANQNRSPKSAAPFTKSGGVSLGNASRASGVE
jgi:hypothetical protein